MAPCRAQASQQDKQAVETPVTSRSPTCARTAAIRWTCALALLSALLPTGREAVAADAFPTRPLRMIVPFPPGAITDATGRILATELGKVLGQTVIVENKPGAGTVIGTQATKTAPAPATASQP